MELDSEFAEERKQKAEEKIAVLRSIEQNIRTNLLDLASLLVNSDEKHKSTLQVLTVCKDNVDSIIKRFTGEDLKTIADEMDQSDFKPEEAVEDTFREDEEKRRKRALKTEEEEGVQEEEEVPSSQSIKRTFRGS